MKTGEKYADTFNVLLTVHHAMILVIVQLDAQILFNVFVYL